MLSMKRVVMVSNSDPPSTSTSQAGATVCSLAKRDELVGWEVSPVVFMASLTLLTLTNSITSLTLFQTNRKAQRMANTFQHRLTVTWICTCLTSTLHRAAGLSGAVNNKRSSTYLDLSVHNSAYHDRRWQLLEYAVHSNTKWWWWWNQGDLIY